MVSPSLTSLPSREREINKVLAEVEVEVEWLWEIIARRREGVRLRRTEPVLSENEGKQSQWIANPY